MTAAAAPLPRRQEFSITEPDAAREAIRELYGSRLRISGPVGGRPIISVVQQDAGAFGLVDISVQPEVTFLVDGGPAVVVDTVLDGTVETEHGRDTHRYGQGDVLLGIYPDAAFSCRTRALRVQTVNLPPRLLGAIAGPERAQCPWRFVSGDPVSPAAGRQWIRTSAFAADMLNAPEPALTPLVVGNTARLLAATLLTVFPNTLVEGGTTPADRPGAAPRAVRRAVAYIEEHADRDIALVDIARAAHLTPRAVQYAFRRHLDTTPLGYLRRVRLIRAHAELLAADPARTTVADVAARWGFLHAGRFAGYYRRAFGCPPSTSLSHDA